MVSSVVPRASIDINQEDLTKTARRPSPVFVSRVRKGKMLHGSDQEEPQLNREQ